MGTSIADSTLAIHLYKNTPALKRVAGGQSPRSDQISAEDFISMSQDDQKSIVNRLNNNDKKKLFSEVRQAFANAATGQGKDKCTLAALQVSIDIINNMAPCQDYKQLAVNVLKFMHENIKYANDMENAPPRDACMFSGEQVLSEGNYNGCAEAAKLFEALYTRCAEQKGFSSVSCAYTSSFDVDRANPKMIQGNDTPWGHAVIELAQGSESVLVNAAMLEHPMLCGQQVISVNELEKLEIFLHADNKGEYKMTMNDPGNIHQETYKLFGKDKYNLQSNPKDPFDPATSDGATRIAVRNFLEENHLITPQK